MSVAIQRLPLTDTLLATLRAPGITIGDGELPDSSWIGEPNLPGSEFAPFAVLSERTADRSSGPLAHPQRDWRMPYLVEYFGISREQCDWVGDKLRNALASLVHTWQDLGDARYRVQQIRSDSIGQPGRIESVNPPFWHAQDGLTVWLGRSTT